MGPLSAMSETSQSDAAAEARSSHEQPPSHSAGHSADVASSAMSGDDRGASTGEHANGTGESGGDESGTAPMDISNLSVREDDDDEEEASKAGPVGDGWDTPADTPPSQSPGGERGDQHTADGEGPAASGATTGKTRRASVLSSSSSSTTAPTFGGSQPISGTFGGGGGGTADSEGPSASSSRTGRRKAARLGSFQGTPAAGEAPPSNSADPPDAGDADVSAPAAAPASSAHHVDIVSYPSSDLLRLLAALLEQIAHANDERNARVAAGASTPGGPATTGATAAAGAPSATPSEAQDTVMGKDSDGGAGGDGGQAEADWRRGRFDAAPLNSPITPRHRKRFPGGPGGPGILDNALASSETPDEGDGQAEADEATDEEHADEMPLTPGMDLLRETASGGGVEGFMPSLGGTHQPQPLSRRRGSSFLRNKRNDDGTIPLASRRTGTSLASGPAPPASSTGSNLPSSAPGSRPGTASNASSGSSSPATAMRPPPAPTGNSPSPSSNPLVQNETPMSSLLTASAVAFSSPNATLCFHARNVPSISIEAYLQRILKYCPTTNEVFLALLVYFDRMARIGLEAQRLGLPKDQAATQEQSDAQGESANANKLFAIDSFNVHRLVIAGVTVASKFFSDVFYTNSRYAKVGGLPLHELNQLELQFLLLNDFRLKIPVDELQRYADQLILYWVGRNGTSNPAAAATASSSRPPSQRPRPRSPCAAPPAPTPQPMPTSSAPSMRIETPPLTQSGMDAANSQAGDPGAGAEATASPSHSYPAHLAHSSRSSSTHQQPSQSQQQGAESQATPSVKPFATGSYSGPASAVRSSSATRPSPRRPQSVRSHPSTSSSFSSSTVTPGTPSTTRTTGSSGRSSDDEYGATDRFGAAAAYGDAMDED